MAVKMCFIDSCVIILPTMNILTAPPGLGEVFVFCS